MVLAGVLAGVVQAPDIAHWVFIADHAAVNADRAVLLGVIPVTVVGDHVGCGAGDAATVANVEVADIATMVGTARIVHPVVPTATLFVASAVIAATGTALPWGAGAVAIVASVAVASIATMPGTVQHAPASMGPAAAVVLALFALAAHQAMSLDSRDASAATLGSIALVVNTARILIPAKAVLLASILVFRPTNADLAQRAGTIVQPVAPFSATHASQDTRSAGLASSPSAGSAVLLVSARPVNTALVRFFLGPSGSARAVAREALAGTARLAMLCHASLA